MHGERERIHVGRAPVDMISRDEVLAHAGEILAGPGNPPWPATIVTTNAQFVYLARKPRFADVLDRADFSVADGMSLVLASHLLRTPLPGRIAGIDLVMDLCALLNRLRGSIYLLGGTPGAARATAAIMGVRYPRMRVAGVDCPPLGFEKSPQTAEATLTRIQDARPDLLLVAFGAPKQEYWIDSNLMALPCKLAMGVGCTFDVASERLRRAPVWMQTRGLEWLFRLSLEPRRLWKRYLVCNTYFAWIVLLQIVQQLFRGKRAPKVEVVS